MGKLAFLFSGQGAQTVGMGKELAQSFAVVDRVFDEASDALGFDVKKLVWESDAQTLQITENTQPAILTMSVAALRVLEEKGVRADACAGLSLGEYSANVCAGSIDFKEAVNLVRKRGKYMQEAVPAGKGTMAAIMGLDADDVVAACGEASDAGIVEPANFNCPGQIVVAGEVAAVERCCEIAKGKGAKRAMVLAVSAPFHCSMLAPAGEKLADELQGVTFSGLQIPLVANVTADYIEGSGQIKQYLIRQVSSPVRWEDSVRRMIADGVDTFIEVGPGKALCGFMKKIDPEKRVFNVEDISSLNAALEGLGI